LNSTISRKLKNHAKAIGSRKSLAIAAGLLNLKKVHFADFLIFQVILVKQVWQTPNNVTIFDFINFQSGEKQNEKTDK
jgi:hypothetical protein